MKITELKIGDRVKQLRSGEVFTITTLNSGNLDYPIKFKERYHANWSLPYIQENFRMVDTVGHYEIY